MERAKVRLSPQGQDYRNNPNCSKIVRSILNSIDSYSAEVLDVEESIIRVKLLEETLPDEFINYNNFAIHRDHLAFF